MPKTVGECVTKRRVLIIAEYIAPVQAVAAIRWTKYAKHLVQEHGCDVTVITNEKGFDGKRLVVKPYACDRLLAEDASCFDTVTIPVTLRQALANVVFNMGSRALATVRSRSAAAVAAQSADASKMSKTAAEAEQSGKGETASSGMNLPERIFEFVDGACGCALTAAGARLARELGPFDVMISSYGPVWPHQLADAIKSMYPQTCWIADFRDPVVRSTRTDTPARRALAATLTRNADCVLAVSDGTAENLYLPSARRVEVLENGFDDPVVGRRPDGPLRRTDVFSLVYTGTLYADSDCRQDMSPLFQSLQRLIDRGAIEERDVLVEYAGISSHLFAKMAARFPRIPIKDHGLVTRADALSLQRSASALVVCTWNTSMQRGVLTGKLFEYMQQYAPIIGLCWGDISHSDLRRIIEECRVGVCHEQADATTDEALDACLLAWYRAWKAGGSVVRDVRSRSKVERYSYRELTNRLVRLMDDITR